MTIPSFADTVKKKCKNKFTKLRQSQCSSLTLWPKHILFFRNLENVLCAELGAEYVHDEPPV